MKLSKKLIREINLVSVYENVLRERFESSLAGFFCDNRPDMWSDEEREAFDMVTAVEDRLKAAILRVLGVEAEREVLAQYSECESSGGYRDEQDN